MAYDLASEDWYVIGTRTSHVKKCDKQQEIIHFVYGYPGFIKLRFICECVPCFGLIVKSWKWRLSSLLCHAHNSRLFFRIRLIKLEKVENKGVEMLKTFWNNMHSEYVKGLT